MQMLATILTLCGITMLLTSCSSDDEQATSPVPGPIAGKLYDGTWYCSYEATGAANGEGPSSVTAAYNVVIDIYHFNPDGSGDFQRCFFGDDDTDPVLVHGILGYGDFTYTTTADGTVTITLKHDWNQSYPQQWTVRYADDAIAALGVGGQTLKLERADVVMQAALNKMTELNGGSGTKYNVNAGRANCLEV